MNRHLPDVNVLFALVWPRHEFYTAAQSWFASSGRRAWASNALTQLGVLRLLTNPALTQGAVSAANALAVVAEATSHAGHEFWPLDHDVAAGLKPFTARLRGYQQWTDALLLRQAMERQGVLVTFDSGVKELAAEELRDHLLILKLR